MTDWMDQHPADISRQLHARIKFLSLASLAISGLDEGSLSDSAAWEGLFYFTQDLLDLSSALVSKTA